MQQNVPVPIQDYPRDVEPTEKKGCVNASNPISDGVGFELRAKPCHVPFPELHDLAFLEMDDIDQTPVKTNVIKPTTQTSVWQYFDSFVEETDSDNEWKRHEPPFALDSVILEKRFVSPADHRNEKVTKDLPSNLDISSHDAMLKSTYERATDDGYLNATELPVLASFSVDHVSSHCQIVDDFPTGFSSKLNPSSEGSEHALFLVQSSDNSDIAGMDSGFMIAENSSLQEYTKNNQSCYISSDSVQLISKEVEAFNQQSNQLNALRAEPLLNSAKDSSELDVSKTIDSTVYQEPGAQLLIATLLDSEEKDDNIVSCDESIDLVTKGCIPEKFTQQISIEASKLISCQEQEENHNQSSPLFEYKNMESKSGIAENFIEGDSRTFSISQQLSDNPVTSHSNILKGPVSLNFLPQPFKNSNASFTVEKKRLHEDETNRDWYGHKLHVFIFTYSGKPVFTRYGREESLSAFTGTLAAILTTMQSLFSQTEEEDLLRCMSLRGHCFAFLQRGPLWLTAISSSGETFTQLQKLLNGVHLQIISLLTRSIEKTLLNKPSYDVRQLLGGTDSVICNFISWFSKDMLSVVDGFEPLPLSPSTRAIANSILKNFGSSNIFAGILVAHHRVVAICVSKAIKLLASDIALLLNLVASSASLRQAESWTPVCLPGVDDRAFLYAYVNFLSPDTIGFIGLTSNSDGEQFYAISEHFKKAAALLSNTSCLQEVYKSLYYSPYQLETPLWDQLELIHLLYYSPSLRQYFSSRFSRNYGDKMHSKRIIRLYDRCNFLLDNHKTPAHVYLNAKHESVYLWRTTEFHLYICVPRWKDISTAILQQMADLVKKHMNFLFIVSIPSVVG